jgi:allantoin racemase
LKDVEWDLNDGIPAPDVENREELPFIVPGILKLVREACESGKHDVIIIIGGLDPGLYAAMEIGVQFIIPVSALQTLRSPSRALYGTSTRPSKPVTVWP